MTSPSFMYLVGAIDTRGHFNISQVEDHRGTYMKLKWNCQLTFITNREETPHFLKNHFGGNVTLERRKGNKHHVHKWRIAGKELDAFLVKVFPHLILLREEAAIVMEMRRTFDTLSGYQVSAETTEKRQEIYTRYVKFHRGKKQDNLRPMFIDEE